MPRQGKGGEYSVPPKKQCGKLLKDGSRCRQGRKTGQDACRWHATKRFNPSAHISTLPNRELNTIQDLVGFLSEVIMCFKNGGVDAQDARTIATLSKELIAAIKERDSNAPEAAQRRTQELQALMVTARGMDVAMAREILLSRNFGLLETKPTVNVVNVQPALKLIQELDGDNQVQKPAG